MIQRFSPRLEILPQPQQEVWPGLADVAKLGFVLYGGTAIALQLGHRVSVDFDFFTDRLLDKSQIRETCSFMSTSMLLQDSVNTLTVEVKVKSGSVKISFFGGIDFGRINNPLETDDGVLVVASLEDLLANKLKVIVQRAEKKDYQDIKALIENGGVSLSKALAAAEVMFVPNFQASIALKALGYFNDGDLPSLESSTKKFLARLAADTGDLPEVALLGRELRSS
jgi:hypothetical protein